MSRGIRNTAPVKLPEGVKLAKWAPVILVPRPPLTKQQRRMEGTDLAQDRRQATDPNADKPLALRYPPCCEVHKSKMTLEAIEKPERLASRCQQLAMQLGHLGLRVREAKLTWVECEDEMPCADCVEEYEAKRKGQAA